MIDNKLKKCSVCGVYKPHSLYGNGGRGKIMARCKACVKREVQVRNARKKQDLGPHNITIDNHLYDVFMRLI